MVDQLTYRRNEHVAAVQVTVGHFAARQREAHNRQASQRALRLRLVPEQGHRLVGRFTRESIPQIRKSVDFSNLASWQFHRRIMMARSQT